MSNSQRRTTFRHRRKAHPGPHNGESSYGTDRYRMGQRLHSLLKAAVTARREEARAALDQRPIPVSGAGRRRAKAHRNRGLCVLPGGGRCGEWATIGVNCDRHQAVVEVEVEVELTDA